MTENYSCAVAGTPQRLISFWREAGDDQPATFHLSIANLVDGTTLHGTLDLGGAATLAAALTSAIKAIG